MIVAAAVVPHPPALLAGLTGEPDPDIERVRTVAVAAVEATLAMGADRVIGIGGAARTAEWTNSSIGVEGFLGRSAAASPLPLSLSVIRSLLPARACAAVRLHSVAFDTTSRGALQLGSRLAAGEHRVALLVAADGSVRSGPSGPGHLDDRAAAYDAGVERALAEADTESLAQLDPLLAEDLLVAGRAAWQVLAGACAGQHLQAQLDYSDRPFGVWYAVARWQERVAGAAP